jgi:hypothetical protein
MCDQFCSCNICLGPSTGSPKIYSSFNPQPMNPREFAEVAQAVMAGAVRVSSL